MKIEYIEEIKDEKEREYLWNEGVCLDDWDYMLVFEYNKKTFKSDNSPVQYNIERLLNGCCSNTWYRLNFRGSEKIIGVAYHS